MHMRPSIALNSLPRASSWRARFAFAVAIGFEGVELGCGPAEADAVGEAAEATGLVVHGCYCDSNWRLPLSSGDREVLRHGIRDTLEAIETAHRLGAESILIIPGLVDRDTSYLQAYARSQRVIRDEILPVARDLGITIAIENVWNGMLLGPLEYARYIDELDSPCVRAMLDVGNAIFGHCQDWIEILGRRIVKLHIKDSVFSKRWGRYRSCRLGAGGTDWPRVRQALDQAGFSGWATLAGVERAVLADHLIYYAAQHCPERLLAKFPGSRAALTALQRLAGRRMLTDAFARFQRHLAEPASNAASALPDGSVHERATIDGHPVPIAVGTRGRGAAPATATAH